MLDTMEKKQYGLGQYGKDRFRGLLTQKNERQEKRLAVLFLNINDHK